MNRYFSLLVVITVLIGCARNPQLEYDENAILKRGVIISKRELLNDQPFEQDMILMPVAGLFLPVLIGEPSKDGSDYIYGILTTDEFKFEVLSKFSGFEEGQCVKLYLSEKIPPRISNGSGCVVDN